MHILTTLAIHYCSEDHRLPMSTSEWSSLQFCLPDLKVSIMHCPSPPGTQDVQTHWPLTISCRGSSTIRRHHQLPKWSIHSLHRLLAMTLVQRISWRRASSMDPPAWMAWSSALWPMSCLHADLSGMDFLPKSEGKRQGNNYGNIIGNNFWIKTYRKKRLCWMRPLLHNCLHILVPGSSFPKIMW